MLHAELPYTEVTIIILKDGTWDKRVEAARRGFGQEGVSTIFTQSDPNKSDENKLHMHFDLPRPLETAAETQHKCWTRIHFQQSSCETNSV